MYFMNLLVLLNKIMILYYIKFKVWACKAYNNLFIY